MSDNSIDQLAAIITATLEDHKAQDIVNLDVRALTDVMDRIIICSATSKRQAHTLADKTRRAARTAGFKANGIEGEEAQEDWVLLDFLDVVVHIMLPETREFYSLEKLWGATAEHREKNTAEKE